MGNLLSCCLSFFNNDSFISEPTIPAEVIIEILTYMPLKSLSRLQLVCKEWQAIIHDHHFTEKYIDREEVIHHWFNIVPTNRNPSPDMLRIRVIHGLDGLILLEILNTHKVCIWNPATRCLLELPDPHKDNYGFAFSYIPATKNYRVVSVYKESGRECCEVFTPGHSKTWSCLMFPGNVNFNWQKVSVISSGGVVHCLSSDVTSDDHIVSIDIGTESFTLNFVPKSLFEDWTKVCALDWDGKLAFADINGENLEVTELEDYRKQRWSQKKKVIHLPFIKMYGYETSQLLTVSAKKGHIWFWLKGKKVFSYMIETGRTTDIHQSDGYTFQNKLIYPFKSSLVNFEGMQPEDPRLQKYRPRKLTN